MDKHTAAGVSFTLAKQVEPLPLRCVSKPVQLSRTFVCLFVFSYKEISRARTEFDHYLYYYCVITEPWTLYIFVYLN